MDNEIKKNLEKVAGTIRGLAMDGVQKANSGHPGLPLGCAEIGAYLYGYFLKHNPKNSNWLNRDRFVLSAGHGSMLLYACLHLSGFKLSLEDLRSFRQLHSRTPGHPEKGHTDGVETTTGPLGQGIGHAAGMALGLKMLQARFNTESHEIINNKVIVLAGDGCLMEGVSAEVASIAGHLKLDNLILIWDDNKVTLDGPLKDCDSEDTKKRFEAYGFDVYEVDGSDFDALDIIFSKVRTHQTRPVLIAAHTIIGKGSPHKQGTSKAHGEPLGTEELIATKEALGISLEDFYVSQAVRSYFDKKLIQDTALEESWHKEYALWRESNGDLAKIFDRMKGNKIPEDLEELLRAMKIKSPLAGRNAANEVINKICPLIPQLIGGSADLSGSDKTMLKDSPLISSDSFIGRNIKYGTREFAMASMACGLSETGMFFPYIGTFLVFSDYMRNAIRLASMMELPIIYQFTHDSLFLGEDGPTHQAVEHYAALRAIPRLHFIRPADNNEVKMAWLAALKYQGPTALALSRQNLPEVKGTDVSYGEGVGRGGYIIKKEETKPDFTFFATGSELSLAMDVMLELEKRGKSVRVVSMPCFAIFDKQSDAYKQSVIGGDLGCRISIEAGVSFGWHKYIGIDGIAICQDTFGASAPASALAKEFGFTVDAILERLLGN